MILVAFALLMGLGFSNLVSYFQYLNYSQASLLMFVSFFTFAIIVDTRNKHLRLGNFHFIKLNYAEAVKAYEKAIECKEGGSEKFAYAAAAYLNLSESEKSIKVCNEGLRLYPEDVNILSNRANAYIRLQEANRAMEDIEVILNQDPQSKVGRSLRAYANFVLCRYKEVIDDTNEPSDTEPFFDHLLRAAAFASMFEMDRAFDELEKATEKIPQKLEAKYLSQLFGIFGYVHLQNNDLENALIEINKALEMNPDQHTSLLNRAFISSVKKQYDDARRDLDELEEKPITDYLRAFSYSNRARIHLQLDELQAAREYVLKAEKAYPGLSDIRCTLGIIQIKCGEYQDALDVLTGAIQLNAYSAEAFFYRAMVYSHLDELEKAVADTELATKYGYRPYLDVS